MNFPRIRMRSPVDLLPANAALLARLQGFEPWTYGLEGRCSILLSYRRIQEFQSHILTRKFLYFFPLPQGQGSLRPTWTVFTKILDER